MTTARPVRVAPPTLERRSRDQWLQLRRSGIGGSDIAAILGLDEHRSALDVYFDKKGMGEARRSEAMDEAARFGHLHEELIAREFARRAGLRLYPSPGMLARADRPWMRADIDRLVAPPPARQSRTAKVPLEIKTRSAYQSAQWQDEPADTPAIQLQWYLAVTGASHGYLAALIGGNSLRWYQMARDDELIGMLVEAGEEFMQRLADDSPPAPDGSPRTALLLDSIWSAAPGSVALLGQEQAAEMRRLRDIVQRCDERVKASEWTREFAVNEMKMIMEDSEVAIAGTEVLATWRRNGTFRKRDFMRDCPELAERYAVARPDIDTRRLAEDEPERYTSYRSRRFLIGGG